VGLFLFSQVGVPSGDAFHFPELRQDYRWVFNFGDRWWGCIVDRMEPFNFQPKIDWWTCQLSTGPLRCGSCFCLQLLGESQQSNLVPALGPPGESNYIGMWTGAG